MQESRSTLPILYIRHIAEQVRRMGADQAAWLTEGGLMQAQLDDPSFDVGLPRFERLVLGALRVTGEPALGLLIGERLLANTHGIVGYAAIQSGTIREALDLLCQFTRLRFSMLSITYEARGQEVRVRFVVSGMSGAALRPVLEAVVLSIKNVLDSMSTGTCDVLEVSFPFAAPAHAALARELFGCDVVYGRSWAGFTIPADVLDVPLKFADAEAFREAARICQRELDKLTESESLAARVRRLLLEKQNGFPSLNVTARLFHMTPRTLHRRLLDEGTSYRELLEGVRHTLAVEHLKNGRLSIEEIAYSLGYSDLANFRRAFKRWESVPPSAYRESKLER